MKVRTTITITDEERVALGAGEKATTEQVSAYVSKLWDDARAALVKQYLQDRLKALGVSVQLTR